MTITSNDIKLYQAQDNTDNDSGGGSRTSNEIVDGDVNNLFPDISRIDTVSGDVALRKVLPAVTTSNRDVYYGAHGMIRKPPTDPKVSAMIFHTDDPYDIRSQAQNKIESYVTGSYREQFWLYGSHIVGATAVTFLQNLESQVPDVGSVYLLKENTNEQYIRVTDLSTQEVIETYNNATYERRRIICLIDQPLNYAFTGSAFHPSGQVSGSADTFATQVGAESKFYGTKTLKDDLTIGDTALMVDSIYEQLVPATKKSTPLVNQSAVTQGDVLVPTGNIITRIVKQSTIFTDEVVTLPDAVVPGSITYLYSAAYDDGYGNIYYTSGNIKVAEIDYKTGQITWTYSNVANPNITYETAAIFQSKIQYTGDIFITGSNQSATYIRNLAPMPSSLDLYVDYRSQGKWYRLYINEENSPLGSLTLYNNNDGTGTVTISLASVPDIDSSVLVSWGSSERLSNRQTFIASETQAYMEIALGKTNIDVTSFNMNIDIGGANYDITCDGNGNLVESSNYITTLEGYVDHINGKLVIEEITPSTALSVDLNSNNTTIDFDYTVEGVGESGEIKTVIASRTPSVGQQAFLTENQTAGTLSFNIGESVEIGSVTLLLKTRTSYSLSSTVGESKTISLRSKSDGTLVFVGGSGNASWGTVSANGDVNITFPDITVKRNSTISDFLGGGSGAYQSVTEKMRLMPTDANNEDEITVVYTTGAPLAFGSSHNITDLLANIAKYKIKTTPNIIGEIGCKFLKDTTTNGLYSVTSKNGEVFCDKTNTGFYSKIGTIDYVKGEIEIDYHTRPDESLFIEFTKLFSDEIGNDGDVVPVLSFRTASTKLTTSSFQLRYETANGSYTAMTDENGLLWATVTGGVGSGLPTDIDQLNSRVDPLTGLVSVKFTTNAIVSSVKYDAVAETTLPLDPELLGLDPVRLPSDGRVPVFASGRHLVIFHENTTAVSGGTPVADQVQVLSRTGQAYIEVIDANGKRLNPVEYTADRATGTITFANQLTLEDKYGAALTAPYSIIDRVEDMLMATDVEINGQLSLSGGVSYAFPKDETKVASALVWGDVGARVYNLFSQEIWDSGNPTWSDSRIGDNTTAQYDNINSPIQIDNKSSSAGRWAIIFTNNTTVKVAHEKLGVVQENISISVDDVEPTNPATGLPYFTMAKEGFGAGWVTNNVIRFNTDSGDMNMWVIRTVQSGALSELEDSIDIEVRGDAN